MIIPAANLAAAPVAYAGGQPSTARPGFGATLQATLAQLQATNQGVTSGAAGHHKHHAHGLFQHNAPFAGSSGASTASLALPPL